MRQRKAIGFTCLHCDAALATPFAQTSEDETANSEVQNVGAAKYIARKGWGEATNGEWLCPGCLALAETEEIERAA